MDSTAIGIMLALCFVTLGWLAFELWRESRLPRCWRCGGATDCHGTACPACRARLKDEIDRRHEIGKAGAA
jgi:hypothetical protein